MTVSSNTSTATFLPNNATVFPLPFRFFNNDDLNVYRIDTATGAAMLQVLGVDYSLTGAGEPEVDGNATGVLTLAAPLAVGGPSLFIERVMDVEQPTDIVNQGRFFPEVHEDTFDRLTMLIQQANANSDGAIRVAIGDPTPSRLPPAAQRALKILTFDADGDPIAEVAANGSATDLEIRLRDGATDGNGADIVAFSLSALGAQIRTLMKRGRDSVSWLDFIPEAEHAAIIAQTTTYDVTTHLQQCFDFCQAFGKKAWGPAGKYIASSQLNISAALIIEGEGCEPLIAPVLGRGKGTWIEINHAGKGFNVDAADHRSGIQFRNFGTYRNQPDPTTPGWTPGAFDYDIHVDSADVLIEDVMMYNPTKGVRIVNGGYGRLTINRLRGQFLQVGISADLSADTCRFRDIHSWPFWTVGLVGDQTAAYTRANLIPFDIGRCDNSVIEGCFSIRHKTAIRLRDLGSGPAFKLRIDNCDFDLGATLLDIDSSCTNATVFMNNTVTEMGSDNSFNGSHNIKIAGTGNRLMLSNSELKNSYNSVIDITGTGNIVRVSNLTVAAWNRENAGANNAPGFNVAANNTLIFESAPQVTQAATGTPLLFSGAGTIRSPLVHGGATITTDVNGRANITHNAGVIPRVVLMDITGANSRQVKLISSTATVMTVEVRDAAGAIVPSTAGISVNWEVKY